MKRVLLLAAAAAAVAAFAPTNANALPPNCHYSVVMPDVTVRLDPPAVALSRWPSFDAGC